MVDPNRQNRSRSNQTPARQPPARRCIEPHHRPATSHSTHRHHSPHPRSPQRRSPPTRNAPHHRRSSNVGKRPPHCHRLTSANPLKHNLTRGNPLHDRPKQRQQPIQRPKDPPNPNQPIPAANPIPNTHNLPHGATQRTQARIGGRRSRDVHPPVNSTPTGQPEVKTPSITKAHSFFTMTSRRRSGVTSRSETVSR